MNIRLIKIIDKCHEAWLQDDDNLIPIIAKPIEDYFKELHRKEDLYSTISYHYLTLSNFKQAAIYQGKLNQLENKIDNDYLFLDTYKYGYIVLNYINI